MSGSRLRPSAPYTPQALAAWFDRLIAEPFQAKGPWKVDFLQPAGEEALSAPDSVSWRVFRNPMSLFIGGIAAVLLELAEPRVRSGVWDYTAFKTDPIGRMRRTGLAAMVTIYGARSVAEPMIERIHRMHDKVRGVTPDGVSYHANDPELLCWVQVTAEYGFLEAYRRFVRPLGRQEGDRLYREGAPAARLYGAGNVPVSEAEAEAMFQRMKPLLEPSPIVREFLDIMKRAPVLPIPFRVCHGLLLRAAVEILPDFARDTLGLGREWRLRKHEAAILRTVAGYLERSVMPSSPAAQACLRLGLPADYLCRAAA